MIVSADGGIRQVKLTTATRKEIRRPVNLLIPLELTDDTEADNTEQADHTERRTIPYNLRPRKEVHYNVYTTSSDADVTQHMQEDQLPVYVQGQNETS